MSSGGSRAPPHFSTKMMPEGSKKFFRRPPPLPLSEGLDRPLMRELLIELLLSVTY